MTCLFPKEPAFFCFADRSNTLILCSLCFTSVFLLRNLLKSIENLSYCSSFPNRKGWSSTSLVSWRLKQLIYFPQSCTFSCYYVFLKTSIHPSIFLRWSRAASLHSQLLQGDRAPHPFTMGAPRHPMEETRFDGLYPGSFSLDHEPKFTSAAGGWSLDWQVNGELHLVAQLLLYHGTPIQRHHYSTRLLPFFLHSWTRPQHD